MEKNIEVRTFEQYNFPLSGSNRLSGLPPEIGQLEHLTILELQDNNISKLPQQMESLSNLVRLNLSHNKLTELPDCLCHLKDLRVTYFIMPLPFSNPKRDRVWACFIGFIWLESFSLQVLALPHNQIESVSDNINSLLSLDDLDLSHNKLKTLPDAFTFLSRTKKVWVVFIWRGKASIARAIQSVLPFNFTETTITRSKISRSIWRTMLSKHSQVTWTRWFS